jgi:hypothetical protein
VRTPARANYFFAAFFFAVFFAGFFAGFFAFFAALAIWNSRVA